MKSKDALKAIRCSLLTDTVSPTSQYNCGHLDYINFCVKETGTGGWVQTNVRGRQAQGSSVVRGLGGVWMAVVCGDSLFFPFHVFFHDI